MSGRGPKRSRKSGPARNARSSSGAGGDRNRRSGQKPAGGGSRSGGSGSGGGGRSGGSRSKGSGRAGGDGRRTRADRPDRSRAAPRGLGGDLVEGRQAVRELLVAGRRNVREVVMIDDLAPADILDDIVELADDRRVPVKRVTRRRFEADAATESHQGVLAKAASLREVSLAELASEPGANLLVLDGVTDPGNLGALLRTAECAGVTGIVLARHRAVHVSPTVTKTAAGAVEYLPMTIVGGIPSAIAELNDLGVLTIGMDMDGDTAIFEVPLDTDQPVALVLGAEGRGLGRLVRDRVQVVSSIPMRGRLNSLNVATAGAVAMFEVVRRRGA